ncbi:hypothetical protein DKX38_026399 [Salix brachista]|uniref:GH16 domain-containing protein n=1 Tax=Salix brachista TaxID=2182728 RepID=A0A5N5J9M3_9ROSI|nr:hypothetical protein DKX38_026399 [Salix brachista]
MAVAGAKLALLLIPILGVAGDGYSSSQENFYGSDNHEHPKRWDFPFKSGLVIGRQSFLNTSKWIEEVRTERGSDVEMLNDKHYHDQCLIMGMIFFVIHCVIMGASMGGDFFRDFYITWGDQRAKILNGGQLLTLSLDKDSGSGFRSKNEYLFGRIDMQIKLPLKNCSSHQLKLDYSFKGGFVIGYLVFSTSVAICFTSYCVPWVYAGERKKKITILGMMVLMRRRKHKITEDGQAGSSLLEEGTREDTLPTQDPEFLKQVHLQ